MYKLDLDGGGTRDQIASICWITEKVSNFQKNIYVCLTTQKPVTMWITTNWKILKEMGIPDHLSCLLRNLYAGQEATVRTGTEKQTDSKLGKEYNKAAYCHLARLTSMQSTP